MDAIEALLNERRQLQERIDAIDTAVDVLEGRPLSFDGVGRRAAAPQVGDDKLDAVRAFVKKMGRVRQADIVQKTGFNSGTVSQALAALAITGEVKPSGKEDRSRVWEAATTK